ncbi:hypothetical protein PDESU_04281 [Pontiella desulfatans]|uniref:Uncharacterized protein n=2 Tax=Pontiella desulfatans TaxID=2750659 RepID=A0A6C2U8F7_PONDE|nr:hypothetical protein PDESU_04281 [Pontiella desulfatans]
MGAALPPYFNPPVESLIKWIIDLLKRGEILMIVASEYVPVSVRVIGAQLAVDLSSLGLKVEFLNYDAPKVRQDIFRAEESAKALLSEQGTKHPLSFGCQPLGELHVVEYLPFYGLTDTASHIRENSKGADVIIINALPRMVGDIHVRKESLSWVRKKLGLAARASDVAIILLNHTRESLLEKPPTFRPEINHAKGMKHVTHTVDHALFIGNGDKRDTGDATVCPTAGDVMQSRDFVTKLVDECLMIGGDGGGDEKVCWIANPKSNHRELAWLDGANGRFRSLGRPGEFFDVDMDLGKFVLSAEAESLGLRSAPDVAGYLQAGFALGQEPAVQPELPDVEVV